MRKALSLVVMLALMAGCTAFPEKKKADWKSATKSERLNELFWEDVANKRWKNLKEHLAPLAVWNQSSEHITGADQILAKLQAEGVTAAQVGEVESQPAGADLVTTYTLTIGNRPPQRVMAVWQPAAKHWVLIALSVTMTPQ